MNRKLSIAFRRLRALVAVAVLLGGLAWQAAAASIDAVLSVSMTVSDMERAVEFYATVLTFEKLSDVEVAGPDYEHLTGVFGARMRVVRMSLGDEQIELVEYIAPRGRPIPPDARSNDRSFQHIAIIVSDMEKAYRRLCQHRVEHASSGPQRLPDWNPNAGGIAAFYFKDPDGHPLEILHFPPGKGDARWHVATDKLFLGIDHTAIVVWDTEASLRFYRDVLGLQVAGESENYGTEQEHLNNVFGARLRITALRAPNGPGIEFLEYLAPRDGKPFPEEERANDIVHRHTTLRTKDAEVVARQLRDAKARLVSAGVVSLTEAPLGIAKGFLVRDPDGHALLVQEERQGNVTQSSATQRP